ncbi:hypothetical protein BDV41DRAFT_527167 [Aspergillus transmontanensis]|uniref:Uncharacterized protein n=1 Tax=Aspergillus transmontanensis TaxID=1034304 RepID=A0A5N6W8X2_9EURO|nr:hypothetical protein BDV41DRAFT_527167 [Aspergillus transmontanensis]
MISQFIAYHFGGVFIPIPLERYPRERNPGAISPLRTASGRENVRLAAVWFAEWLMSASLLLIAFDSELVENLLNWHLH